MSRTKKVKYELPLIITRNQVYFPHNQSDDLDAGRPQTVEAIKFANNAEDKLLIVATQRVFTINNPGLNDVYPFGVLARLTKVREKPHHVTVQLEPLARVFIESIVSDEAGTFAVAKAIHVPHDPLDESVDVNALKEAIYTFFNDRLELTRRLHISIDDIRAENLGLEELIYFLANKTLNSTEQRMSILEESSLEKRIDLLLKLLEDDAANDAVSAITQIVRNRPQSDPSLQEKGAANPDTIIIEEDEDEEFDSGDEILEKLKTRYFPKNFVTRIKKEVKKMARSEMGERARIIEYLDWVMKLPFDQETIDNLDLINVRKVLDNDHYGLEEPKKRIIEFMAVKRLAKENKATVLCFYGPPGTGKTSLALSIATAMGRKLVKASLGGVDEESKLRGFLRTYVGAQPGIIMSSMRKAGTINPIFVLDEVDKLGKSANRGDPSSALLEILDPEQNKGFIDHYIDEPYDLSKVVFIATANYFWDIPRPLRDRMEMIELKGYTEEEKVQIAERHLIPDGIESHGLKGYDIKFTDEALRFIIGGYTWEAGVRMLDQKISAILRKLSVETLTDVESNFTITPDEVKKHLGRPRNFFTAKEKEPIVGVVTGISVAGNIGDIMKIEVTTFKGKGMVNVTGNLEKMLKESGEIAASHVRSYAQKYGVDPDLFMNVDLNVHFPQASTKDGNSAGVAMTIGIISALTNRKINPNVAMTGEVTLTGRVLAIGGLYEKILGCIRAGIETVMFPEENVIDLEEVPTEVKEKIRLIPIKTIDEAVAIALLPKEDTPAVA
jgi:ATP-dependent Lon protease